MPAVLKDSEERTSFPAECFGKLGFYEWREESRAGDLCPMQPGSKTDSRESGVASRREEFQKNLLPSRTVHAVPTSNMM